MFLLPLYKFESIGSDLNILKPHVFVGNYVSLPGRKNKSNFNHPSVHRIVILIRRLKSFQEIKFNYVKDLVHTNLKIFRFDEARLTCNFSSIIAISHLFAWVYIVNFDHPPPHLEIIFSPQRIMLRGGGTEAESEIFRV